MSAAFFAPPPTTLYTADDDLPLKLAASSPTSSHHTFCSVQLPLQWTPSAPGVPMITFFRTAPSASSKIGSWPSSWLPPPSAPLPKNFLSLPSYVPETSIVVDTALLPLAVGQVVAAPAPDSSDVVARAPPVSARAAAGRSRPAGR